MESFLLQSCTKLVKNSFQTSVFMYFFNFFLSLHPPPLQNADIQGGAIMPY